MPVWKRLPSAARLCGRTAYVPSSEAIYQRLTADHCICLPQYRSRSSSGWRYSSGSRTRCERSFAKHSLLALPSRHSSFLHSLRSCRTSWPCSTLRPGRQLTRRARIARPRWHRPARRKSSAPPPLRPSSPSRLLQARTQVARLRHRPLVQGRRPSRPGSDRRVSRCRRSPPCSRARPTRSASRSRPARPPRFATVRRRHPVLASGRPLNTPVDARAAQSQPLRLPRSTRLARRASRSGNHTPFRPPLASTPPRTRPSGIQRFIRLLSCTTTRTHTRRPMNSQRCRRRLTRRCTGHSKCFRSTLAQQRRRRPAWSGRPGNQARTAFSYLCRHHGHLRRTLAGHGASAGRTSTQLQRLGRLRRQSRRLRRQSSAARQRRPRARTLSPAESRPQVNASHDPSSLPPTSAASKCL